MQIEEHMVFVMVVSLDKAIMSIPCYLASSRPPAMPQSIYFLSFYIIKTANKML